MSCESSCRQSGTESSAPFLALINSMDAFDPIAPAWTETAIHAHGFCCPTCRSSPMAAQRAWINRRSPVFMEDYRRKWQEFYQCECGCVWWAWSDERPPSSLASPEPQDEPW